MSSSINDLKQQIQNLKEKKQRIQQSIRHIWDDIGGLQSDTKEQHRLFSTQEDFREAIQVREHHVERLEFTLLQIENTIRELEERIEMGKEDKKGAGRRRKKGGKINKENDEITKFLLKHDLPSDIKKMRKLLNEAREEIYLGDDITARQDVKEVGAILEQYNLLLAPNTTENYIPADILSSYEEVLDLLRPRPPTLLRRNSPNNSVGDIQFNDADWEFLGAGLSRERENTNGNLRMTGGIEVSDDEMSVDSQGSEESEESNPDEYPFQYNDVLDVLEIMDDLQDDDERRERWDEMGVDAMMNDSNTHLAQEPHLILAPDQEFWVTEVQRLYQFWRNYLFPPQPPQPPVIPQFEGGRMSGGGLIGLLDSNGRVDKQLLWGSDYKSKDIKSLSLHIGHLEGKINEIDKELNFFYDNWDKRNPQNNERLTKLEPLIQPLEEFKVALQARIPEVKAFYQEKVWKREGAKLFNADNLRREANRPGFAEDIHQQVSFWKEVLRKAKQAKNKETKTLAENQIREYEAFINLVGI